MSRPTITIDELSQLVAERNERERLEAEAKQRQQAEEAEGRAVSRRHLTGARRLYGTRGGHEW